MRAIWLLAAAVLAFSLCDAAVQADEAAWKQKHPNYTLIAEQRIDLNRGKDSIKVGGEGRYTGLLLICDAKVELYDIKVKYVSGEEHDPGVRHKFGSNSTRQFDLPGDARAIREVSFMYTADDKKGQAAVKLCGCQTGAREAKLTKMPETGQGLYYLGANDISMAKDRDNIEVGKQPTRFITLALAVPDGELEMWDIKITYASGDTHTPNLRLAFGASNRVRMVEIPRGIDNPDGRRVSKIGFSYKGPRTEGRTKVKLYGRTVEPAKRFEDHVLLATREIDLTKGADAIQVGKDKGKYRSLLIEVENADVTFSDIQITYGNGTSFKAGANLDFDESWRYRKQEFSDKDEHSVASISFKYTVKSRKEGKAVVHVYGDKS